MKTTMQAVAVAVLGMALAAPVWGAGLVRFNVDPNDPLRCEVSFLSQHTGESHQLSTKTG